MCQVALRHFPASCFLPSEFPAPSHLLVQGKTTKTYTAFPFHMPESIELNPTSPKQESDTPMAWREFPR